VRTWWHRFNSLEFSREKVVRNILIHNKINMDNLPTLIGPVQLPCSERVPMTDMSAHRERLMKARTGQNQKYAPSGDLRRRLHGPEFFRSFRRWNEDCGDHLD